MFDDLFAASTKASKITKFINNIITMTDKNLIYFMSITGFKFSDCIRKFKEVMKVN